MMSVSCEPTMVLWTEDLPISAAASFVLGREHVVHKAETNPLEYHQLYTTYASRLVYNVHPKKRLFLLEHKTCIGAIVRIYSLVSHF